MRKGSKHSDQTKTTISLSRQSLCWKWSPEYREKVMISRKKSQKRGKNHHHWKGGKYTVEGYLRVSNGRGKYQLEHRKVMEKFLKRKLRNTEQVHHKNGIKDDNRISNLEIVVNKTHFGIVKCPHCLNNFKIK
jgi:hypothetical protein